MDKGLARQLARVLVTARGAEASSPGRPHFQRSIRMFDAGSIPEKGLGKVPDQRKDTQMRKKLYATLGLAGLCLASVYNSIFTRQPKYLGASE